MDEYMGRGKNFRLTSSFRDAGENRDAPFGAFFAVLYAHFRRQLRHGIFLGRRKKREKKLV